MSSEPLDIFDDLLCSERSDIVIQSGRDKTDVRAGA